MVAKGMDLNRGATMRRHPDGYMVGQYKDEPGTYYNEIGEVVESAVAAEAGFDVALDTIERRKLAKLEEAKARITAEFAAEQERLESEALAESDAALRAAKGEGEGEGAGDDPDGAGEGGSSEPPGRPDPADLPEGFSATKEGKLRETPRLVAEHLGAGKFRVVAKANQAVVAADLDGDGASEVLWLDYDAHEGQKATTQEG